MKTFVNLIAVLSLLLMISAATASGSFKLRDYVDAVRTNDMQRVNVIRSYILGSVETHFLYSKMLKDWTSINILCMGPSDINIDELGVIFDLKIKALRRNYGEAIMDMPIANTVQMIVEEQYKCY